VTAARARLRSGAVAAAVRAARTAPFEAAVAWLDRLDRWPPAGRLAVLTYHRVDAPGRPDRSPGLLSAAPTDFETQVRWLAERFRPVSGDTVVEACRPGGRLPPRAVLVTFDDAYDDFAAHAWPILRRHGVPAVLFVPTGYPDRPDRTFWWDRLDAAVLGSRGRASLDTPLGRLALADEASRRRSASALREAVKRRPHDEAMELVAGLLDALGASDAPSPVLGWDALRALAGEGVTLAAHSRTHPLLTRIPDERLDDEVAGSVADLERELGAPPALFAYPSGAFDDRVVDAVRRAGIAAAFTTDRGVDDLRTADPLRLRRINVGGRSSVGLLHAQLLPTAWRLVDRRRR
jgi:peptidoglycan/xylan/chitin deacetylase (PgdA/CDA1 family)